MPRPAWLAIGAAVGAIALGAIPPLAIVLFAGCGLVTSVAALAVRRPGAARKLAPVALGMAAIGFRGGLAMQQQPDTFFELDNFQIYRTEFNNPDDN